MGFFLNFSVGVRKSDFTGDTAVDELVDFTGVAVLLVPGFSCVRLENFLEAFLRISVF